MITKKYFDDNSSSGGVGKDTNGMSWNEDDESYTGMAGAEIFNNYEYNIASGDYSHAEGDDTTASGPSSHAEGYGTIASANSSHAEGYGTIASGDCSHAEGEFAEASGISAHAEGNSTASGNYSHAEGNSTASGEASHAEGNSNAYGEESHAEGYYADAIGNYSHAEGYNTIASSECQHVQGKYNVEDTEGKYVHIVGWGTSNESKNIHTIDTFGNAMFTGKITVGDGETIPEPTADGDLITKKYFDDNSNNSGNTEYVTPESFGAVGDGVTDDVNAFTQAAATGKPILLTQRYYTSTSITITSSVYSYTNAEIINDAIITFAQNNIIISGITFNGNNSSPYVHCISDNVYFYKCQFKNFSGNENYKLTETLRLGEYNTVTHTGVIVDSCIFNGASSNYENDVEGDNDGVVRQIYIQNCSAKIVNCEFKNCVGMEDGDIIHVQSKSALDSTYPYSKKGGISFPSVPCIISGCIFHLGKCKSAVKVQCSDVIIQNNTVLVEDEATIDDARYVFRAMNCNNVNISSNTVNIEDTTELKLVSIFSIEGMENVILQNNLIYDRSTGISSLYDNSTSVTVILSRFVQTSIFNNNSILLRSIHNLMDIEYSSLTISDNKIECVGDYQDTIFYINKYYNHSTDGSDIPEDVVLRFIHNELIVSGTRNKIQTDTSYAGSVEFSNNKIIGNVSAYDFRFDANAPTTFCRVSDIDLQLKFTTVTGNYLTTLKDIHIERCTLIYADIKKAEVCLIKDCDISSTYQAIYFTNVGEVEVDGNYIHNITNRVFRVMTGNPSINMKNNSFDTGNYSQLVESHYNNDEFLRSNIIWYKNNQGIINGINNGSEPDSTMSYELGCLFFKESENKFVFSNGNGSWV